MKEKTHENHAIGVIMRKKNENINEIVKISKIKQTTRTQSDTCEYRLVKTYKNIQQ